MGRTEGKRSAPTAAVSSPASLFARAACAVRVVCLRGVRSLQPFLDPSHALHALFPPRNYAIGIPVALLVLGVSGIGAFLASVLLKSEKKKKKAA